MGVLAKALLVFAADWVRHSGGGLDQYPRELGRVGLAAWLLSFCGRIAAIFGLLCLLVWWRSRSRILESDLATSVYCARRPASGLATFSFSVSLVGLSFWPISPLGIVGGAVAWRRCRGSDRLWLRLSMAAIIIGAIALTGPIAALVLSSSRLISRSTISDDPSAERDDVPPFTMRSIVVYAKDVPAGTILSADSVAVKNVMVSVPSTGYIHAQDLPNVLGKETRFMGHKGSALLWGYIRDAAEESLHPTDDNASNVRITGSPDSGMQRQHEMRLGITVGSPDPSIPDDVH